MINSNLNQALAIGNLLNLGFAEAEAIRIARTWAEQQFRQSIENMASLARGTVVDDHLPEGACCHRMFASFHYSVYPLLYQALATRCQQRVVYSLIGQQNEQQRIALNRLAAAFCFRVEFIESGTRMVRKLRNGIRNGAAGIVLVDIPWSIQASELDVSYPVPGGRFLGRSSLERLISLIDQEYQFISSSSVSERLVLKSHGSLPLSKAFDWLGKVLQESPADYERLHQLHKYFEFDHPRNAVISFQVQGDRFALHTRTMKAWKVNVWSHELPQSSGEACVDTATLNVFKKVTNDDVESLVFL